MFHYHATVSFLRPAVAVSLLLATAPLAAQPNHGTGTRDGSAVHGVEQAHQIDCEGRPAEVSGSGNRIDFVGDCPSLTINGVGNHISIVLRPGAPVRVSGVENVVNWRVNGQGKPRVAVQGVDNQVRPSR